MPTWVRVRLTLVLLHTPTLEALVQQTNAQSYIDAHALLVDHTRNPVLDEDIGTVGTEFVATVGYLSTKSVRDAKNKFKCSIETTLTFEMTLLYHFLCA